MNVASVVVGAVMVSQLVACGPRASDGGSGDPVETGPVHMLAADTGITAIRDVVRANDGTFWVVPTEAALGVVHYAASGAVIARTGLRGSGPTDFRYPLNVVAVSADSRTAFVWDIGDNAVREVNDAGVVGIVWKQPASVRNGNFLSDFESLTGALPLRLVQAGDTYVVDSYRRGIGRERDLARLVLLRLSRAGTIQDTLVDLQADTADIWMSHGDLALSPTPRFAVCGDGTVALYDNIRDELRMTGGGRTVRIPMRIPQRALSDADLRLTVTRNTRLELEGGGKYPSDGEVARVVDAIFAQTRENYPANFPRVSRALCDTKGDVWLNEFEPSASPRGLGPIWIRIRSQQLSRFRLPAGFSPRSFTSAHFVGVFVDPDGIEHIGLVGIP